MDALFTSQLSLAPLITFQEINKRSPMKMNRFLERYSVWQFLLGLLRSRLALLNNNVLYCNGFAGIFLAPSLFGKKPNNIHPLFSNMANDSIMTPSLGMWLIYKHLSLRCFAPSCLMLICTLDTFLTYTFFSPLPGQWQVVEFHNHGITTKRSVFHCITGFKNLYA